MNVLLRLYRDRYRLMLRAADMAGGMEETAVRILYNLA